MNGLILRIFLQKTIFLRFQISDTFSSGYVGFGFTVTVATLVIVKVS